MTKQILIGVTGPAGSGKDTVVEVSRRMLRAFDRPMRIHAFAAPLKMFVQDVFDFEDEDLYGPSAARERFGGAFAERGPTARKALQTLGTEWGRALHPDVWIKYLERKLANEPESSIVLISDLRFGNEAEWILSNGGYVWSVDASRRLKLGRKRRKKFVIEHASEHGVDSAHVSKVIDNNGTFRQLRFNVLEAVADVVTRENLSLDTKSGHSFPFAEFAE